MTTSIPLRVCQTRSERLEPQKRGTTKTLERRVRTAKYLVFRTRENPWKQREPGGRKSLSCGGFRVSPVMTTSIPLRICSSSKVRETIVIKFFRKPVRYDGQKNHQPSKSPIKSSFSGGFRWYNYSNAHMISDDTQMCTWFRMTLLLSGNATPSDSFTTALLLYQLGGRFAIVFLKIAQKVFVSKFSK